MSEQRKHIDGDKVASEVLRSRVVCAVLGAVLAVMALFCWFAPKDDFSESERRYLRSMPAITLDSVASGRFMDQFEAYAQDAFPFREAFRRTHALANLAFGRLDGNGVYLAWAEDGSGPYACSLDYALDEAAVAQTLGKYQRVYDAYLKDADANVFAAVIPDKGYYLATESGRPALDYAALFAQVEAGMPYVEHVDLTELLEADSYYRTDTHWRQEAIVPVAEALLSAMLEEREAEAAFEVDPGGFTQHTLPEPFFGVYVGQSALPLPPDELVWLENDATRAARAYDAEHGREIPVYDEAFEFANTLDPYEVFLGGPLSLVTVESPLAATERELVVFRDSFGSAIAPLMLEAYAKVTLVDLRYLQPEMLDGLVDFENADVLFLQSTLTINS